MVPWGVPVEVVLTAMWTADNFENAEPSILALLSKTHRITKAGTGFGKFSMVERKQFYKEVVD